MKWRDHRVDPLFSALPLRLRVLRENILQQADMSRDDCSDTDRISNAGPSLTFESFAPFARDFLYVHTVKVELIPDTQ